VLKETIRLHDEGQQLMTRFIDQGVSLLMASSR